MKLAKFHSTGHAVLLTACVAMAPALLLGCGGSDGTRRQVASLEKEIVGMRADQDRLEERLAALELRDRAGGSGSRPPAVTRSEEPVERPRLKVIHMAPENTEPAPVAAPETAPPEGPAARRPVIRGTGERVIKMFDAESSSPSRGVQPVADLSRPAKN